MSCLSIAIDGPAGAGKSTLAKSLAREIGFLYVDTGAIYRSVGLFVEQQGRDCAVAEDVVGLLGEISLDLVHQPDGVQHMYVGGRDVTEEIRQNRVSRYASQVAGIPQVREFLIHMQRELAGKKNVVMDGRDIGTVVLPQADLKIFLTASPETRAKRRFQELLAKGSAVSYEEVLKDMIERDASDRNRPIAPLRQAEDAVLLDTSELNLEESLQALRNIVKEKLKL